MKKNKRGEPSGFLFSIHSKVR